MKETIKRLNINHVIIDAGLEIKEIEKRIEEFING
jgi:dTMP kinase